MANLTPVNSFDNVIRLETNTIALGGVGGIMNAQAQALLNRTAYLKGVYDALTAMIGAVDGNGIAPLVNGKVPSANLPSYVDDVLEYANLASFPTTGETGKLYIALDTNLIYRWTGSTYASTSSNSSLALGETSETAYRGDRGKTAYDHSQATGNPHGTTIANISGLQSAIDDAAVNFAAPTVNPQSGTAYTLGTVTTDNNGKTYLRMTSTSTNIVTIPSTQTKPISISQRGTGTTTLAAGSGVTLNGTLAFTAQHQTKTIVPVSAGVYDVVG